jgi:hypothetical protein
MDGEQTDMTPTNKGHEKTKQRTGAQDDVDSARREITGKQI